MAPPIQDFLNLLNYSNAHLPSDNRYNSFAINTKVSQEILNNAPIEQHIQTLDTLDNPATFEKVWKEINDASYRKCQKPLEQVRSLQNVMAY